MVAQRIGHAWYVLQTTLYRHAHRAAIVGIHRGIVAVVDASDNHIRTTLADILQRHFYAVHRCTVARIDRHALALLPEGQLEGYGCRESAREARAGIIRCTYYDVGYIFQHGRQRAYALSLIAIIVGNQYQWSHFFPSFPIIACKVSGKGRDNKKF